MSQFYCPICGIRPVSREGEICSSCQDPYDNSAAASSAGSAFMPGASSFGQSANTNTSNDQGYPPIRRSTRRIIGAPQAPATPTATGNPRRIIRTDASAPAGTQPNPVHQPIQSAPLQTVTPVPITSQQNHNTQQSKAAAGPTTEGIVKNITQGKDPAGWFRRWMRSLILGVPFARTDDITEFQVYTNWTGTANSSGYSADKVIAYGNISYGMPVQDNAVRVYGVRDKNRVIIADDIENSTDGVHSVFDPAPLSATAVRILTGVVVLLVGFVLYTLFSFIVGVGRGNLTGQSAASAARAGESFSVILSAVICGAIAVFSGKRALKNFGSNWKSAGICGLIALVFAITCISMLQNL